MSITTFAQTVNQQGIFRYVYTNGAVGTSYTTGQLMRDSIQKTNSSRRKKPTGWLYPTDYLMNKEVVRHTSGVITYTGSSQEKVTYNGTAPGNWCNSSQLRYHNGISQALIDRAVTKALLKLKDQKFNASLALAEAQMTADFVGSSALRLAKSLRALSKGRFGEARKALGLGKRADVPQTWLEWQYAALPTMMDVNGAMQALSSKKSHDWVVTVKGVVKDSWSGQGEFLTGTVWAASDASEYSDGCFVRLDYIPTNDVLMHLSSLGITNPLVLLYERVPFSFVLDWFLPVGDWFQVLDATLGYTYLSGSRTSRQESTGTWLGLPYRGGSNSLKSRYWKKTINRTNLPASPLPHLPRLKNPLSLGHMANGLSLLSQATQSADTSYFARRGR